MEAYLGLDPQSTRKSDGQVPKTDALKLGRMKHESHPCNCWAIGFGHFNYFFL